MEVKMIAVSNITKDGQIELDNGALVSFDRLVEEAGDEERAYDLVVDGTGLDKETVIKKLKPNKPYISRYPGIRQFKSEHR